MSELDSVECSLLLDQPYMNEIHDDVSYVTYNDSVSQSTPQMLYFDNLPVKDRLTTRADSFIALPLIFTKSGTIGPGAAYASIDRIVGTKNGNALFITGINSQLATGPALHQETDCCQYINPIRTLLTESKLGNEARGAENGAFIDDYPNLGELSNNPNGGTITTVPKSATCLNDPVPYSELPLFNVNGLTGIAAIPWTATTTTTTGSISSGGSSSTVLTGTGTTFLGAMTGGTLTITSGTYNGTVVEIVGYFSGTSISISQSLNIAAGTTFSISYCTLGTQNNSSNLSAIYSNAQQPGFYNTGTVSTGGVASTTILSSTTSTNWTAANVPVNATFTCNGQSSPVIAFLSATSILVRDSFVIPVNSTYTITYNNSNVLLAKNNTSVFYNAGFRKRLNYRIVNTTYSQGSTSFTCVFYIPLRDIHPLYLQQRKPTQGAQFIDRFYLCNFINSFSSNSSLNTGSDFTNILTNPNDIPDSVTFVPGSASMYVKVITLNAKIASLFAAKLNKGIESRIDFLGCYKKKILTTLPNDPGYSNQLVFSAISRLRRLWFFGVPQGAGLNCYIPFAPTMQLTTITIQVNSEPANKYIITGDRANYQVLRNELNYAGNSEINGSLLNWAKYQQQCCYYYPFNMERPGVRGSVDNGCAISVSFTKTPETQCYDFFCVAEWFL